MYVGELSIQPIHLHVMYILIYFCIILRLPKEKKILSLRNKGKIFFLRLFDVPPETASKGGGV